MRVNTDLVIVRERVLHSHSLATTRHASILWEECKKRGCMPSECFFRGVSEPYPDLRQVRLAGGGNHPSHNEGTASRDAFTKVHSGVTGEIDAGVTSSVV